MKPIFYIAVLMIFSAFGAFATEFPHDGLQTRSIIVVEGTAEYMEVISNADWDMAQFSYCNPDCMPIAEHMKFSDLGKIEPELINKLQSFREELAHQARPSILKKFLGESRESDLAALDAMIETIHRDRLSNWIVSHPVEQIKFTSANSFRSVEKIFKAILAPPIHQNPPDHVAEAELPLVSGTAVQ